MPTSHPRDCDQHNGKKQLSDTRSPPSSNDQVADAKSADPYKDSNLDDHCFGSVKDIGSCDERCGTHDFDDAGTPCLVGLSKVI